MKALIVVTLCLVVSCSLLPDDTGEGVVSTAVQLEDLLELPGVPVEVPDPGPVLPEGVADQVRQVVFPGRQNVEQRIVSTPERTLGVSSGYEVELRPVTEHLGRLVYPGVGLLGGELPVGEVTAGGEECP